jgi:hypothetical protein
MNSVLSSIAYLSEQRGADLYKEQLRHLISQQKPTHSTPQQTIYADSHFRVGAGSGADIAMTQYWPTVSIPYEDTIVSYPMTPNQLVKQGNFR